MFATPWKNVLFLLIVVTLLVSVPVTAQNKQNEPKSIGVPILWRDPGDVSKRNLRYGPGSAELAPVAPYTFVTEESTGESPKFRVTDARGETCSSQAKKERAMKTITVENAIWIGSLLSRLSDDQLRDAFHAANYDTETMEGFVQVLRDRINQLNRLNSAGVTASALK